MRTKPTLTRSGRSHLAQDFDPGEPARSPGVVRVGVFSSDPPACDTFHSFDPESGIVHAAINDSLVYIDCEGALHPGLATSWRRLDPLTVEFDLREGVRFHNGDLFGADDVVATIRAQRDPGNRSPIGQGYHSIIESCTRVNDYRVQIKTSMPDGMFLHRLHLSGGIYPRSVLDKHGPGYFHEHPIGTGGYVFERWNRGREIVLSRNPDHWSGLVTADGLCFPIMDQKDLVDALVRGEIDIALNLDPHDAFRLQGIPGTQVRRREAALSHWFLLRNQGPLADRRVRLALNYAVHRHLLSSITHHGWSAPQASLLTPRQVGFDPELMPYPYDPDHAIQLLREAGYAGGIRLRGLVSESSSGVYQMLRIFLENIGVIIEADIVPRPEWLRRVVTARIMEGRRFEGDFALINIDNFNLHGLFHHAIFLYSEGAYGLMSSPEYDRRFLDAAAKVDPDDSAAAVRELDRYAQDQAFLLFTLRQQVYCGVREGYDIPISVGGHFNFDSLWRIRVDRDKVAPSVPYPYKVHSDDAELQRLLDATTYPGLLYDSGSPEQPAFAASYAAPMLAALWRNIELHEIRWKIKSEQMLRRLVDQVTASTNLDNVLRSTRLVAILGITRSGRVLFENSGYRRVMGHSGGVPLSSILFDDSGQSAWASVAHITDKQGLCTGVFNVRVSESDVRRVFMTVTLATNENGSVVGYVCVVIDHSREEERVRIVQEMEIARRIQVAMLPSVADDERDALAALMIPAEEVGGDYYDIITDDNGAVWYGIGDVSGHGVTSGMVMLMTHCAVRTLIRADPDASMDHILTILNRVIYEDIARIGGRYHVTFALLKSLGNGDYLACGAHEDAIVYRAATGECECIELSGIWLGMLPDIEGMCQEAHIHLDPGDTMVLYTDGVIEAIAIDGSMWGTDELVDSIKRHITLSPDDLLNAILEDITAFMDAQIDDITMMIVRRPG